MKHWYLSIIVLVVDGSCQCVALVSKRLLVGHISVKWKDADAETEGIELSTGAKDLP
mgnify:CR=1